MSTQAATSPAAPATPAAPLAGIYRACGTIGNVGMPGAPIAHYQLLVNPSRGTVTGVIHITQAIAGPGSDITIDVTGTIHNLVFGSHVTHVVILKGEFVYYCPPPALCVEIIPFTVHMAVDNAWNGTGGFEFRGERIENVPVKSGNC